MAILYDDLLFWSLEDQVPALSCIHHTLADQINDLMSGRHKYQKKYWEMSLQQTFINKGRQLGGNIIIHIYIISQRAFEQLSY